MVTIALHKSVHSYLWNQKFQRPRLHCPIGLPYIIRVLHRADLRRQYASVRACYILLSLLTSLSVCGAVAATGVVFLFNYEVSQETATLVSARGYGGARLELCCAGRRVQPSERRAMGRLEWLCERRGPGRSGCTLVSSASSKHDTSTS